MKILILVNTLQNVSSFVYANHVEFFVKTVKTDPTIQIEFFTPHRMAIDVARNNAAKLAMENECDYLMFIDDDVLIPPDTLTKLIEADKDIIAGLVVIRGMPFNNMAFKFKEGSKDHLMYYNELPLENSCKNDHIRYEISCENCRESKLQELIKVDAVGFSCCLINVEVLKAMEPPYFITGANHTEDIYFCLRTRELSPNPEIYLHTDVKCGHLLNPEPIEWITRYKFQEFYKEEAEKAFSRGQPHIDRCLAKII